RQRGSRGLPDHAVLRARSTRAFPVTAPRDVIMMTDARKKTQGSFQMHRRRGGERRCNGISGSRGRRLVPCGPLKPHNLTVPSPLPVAKVPPSGEKAPVTTALLCPRRIARSWPPTTSHSLTAQSLSVVASVLESGDRASGN